MDITIIATGPSCIYQTRPKRVKAAKRQISKTEEGWLNLKPYFETPVTQEGLVQPHGSTKAYSPPPGLARSAEIWELARTQHLELASMAAEFRANGLTAISLSSSPAGENDDDLTAANLAQSHLKMVPYDPDPETIAPLMRRIDWERYILGCSVPTRIYAKVKPDGSLALACENRTWTTEQLAAYAPKIRELIAGRTGAEIANDRERAYYYRSAVWASMTPDQQIAWHEKNPEAKAYLDFADDNRERETWFAPEVVTNGGGPQELNLHSLDVDLEEDGNFQMVVLTEPSEFEFWPLSEDELAAYA